MAQMFAKCGGSESQLLFAQFSFSGSGTYIFSEASASSVDSYVEPNGTFTQQHSVLTNSAVPGLRIHFCRDVAEPTREEVWFYYGFPLFKDRSTGLPWDATDIKDISGHTVTIYNSASTLFTQSLARHTHHCWWRWQRLGARTTRVHSIDYLITNKWLPPYDMSLSADITYDVSASMRGTFPPEPMSAVGIQQDMTAAGERPEIGQVNGHAGRYIFASDNWTDVLIWAEGAGAVPLHWIDETTGRYADVDTFPDIQCHPNNASDNYYVRLTPREWLSQVAGGWFADSEHMPSLAALPAMVLGDPYYVMMSQATTSWLWTKNRRWPLGSSDQSARNTGPWPDYGVRGLAWHARDLSLAWRVTPDTTPSWMTSRSTLQRRLEGHAAAQRYYWTSPQLTTGQNTFKTTFWNTGRGDYASFQETFHAFTLSMWDRMGAPGSPNDLAQFKVDLNLAMTTQRNGYPRQFSVPYKVAYAGLNGLGGSPQPATWGTVYDYQQSATVADESGGGGNPFPWRAVDSANNNFQQERASFTSPEVDWWYVNATLGVLYAARSAGVGSSTAVDTAITYFLSQIARTGANTSNGRYAKWAITVA